MRKKTIPPPTNMPHMLTPQDIASILGVGYETALTFIKHSGIDYVKIGRQYRVSEHKLKAFLSKGGSILIETYDAS